VNKIVVRTEDKVDVRKYIYSFLPWDIRTGWEVVIILDFMWKK
jgi:ERCC4-related helicase